MSDILGTTDVTAAYGVRDELNRHQTSRSAAVADRRIGLTSLAVQKQLGVDQPDFITVADNGSSALIVLGSKHLTLTKFEPVEVEMSMGVDGEVVSTANSAVMCFHTDLGWARQPEGDLRRWRRS